jgi:hypothetical protein
LPLALAGAGIVTAGGFVYFGASAQTRLVDLAMCAPSCSASAIDTARTNLVAGDLLLAASLVAFAASAVVTLATASR